MINGSDIDGRVQSICTQIVRVGDVDAQDAANTVPRTKIHTIRLVDVSRAEVSPLANIWSTLITKCR